MEDQERIRHLEDLLRRALPFLEGYDLMGTGGLVSKKEYTAMNDLEKEIAEAIGEDHSDVGHHGQIG